MAPSTRRRTKRNTRSKERKQFLINMPLDVLIEIFLFLEPLDLLYLARTTKGLRAFLLSRGKSFVLWKNTISNLEDFPPCPDYLSPPAYTHLAFVPVCHGCFRPCETIEWAIRMRCCPTCRPKMTVPQTSSWGIVNEYHTDLDFPTAYSHFELCYDYGLDITIIDKQLPCGYISALDWKVVHSRKRPKKAESLKAFQAERNDFLGSVRQHTILCRKWEYNRLSEKALRLSRVRRKRIEAIKERLKELGWIEANRIVYYDDRFSRLPEVCKTEPLTPTEWTEIQPQLVSWLRKVKEESVCCRRLDIYYSAFPSVQQKLSGDTPFKGVRPLVIDIALVPAVRSAIESDTDSDMSDEEWKKKLLRILPLAFKRWSSNAVQELEQLARKELHLPSLSKPSCLPSVIFRCKACHCRFGFDEALTHRHLYKERRIKPGNTDKLSVFDKLLVRYSYQQPRNIQVLRVDVDISRRVENLVKRIGKNPSRATYHELCQSTVQVVCGLCRQNVATKMEFPSAFKHCLDNHRGKKETEVWTRVLTRSGNRNGAAV